MNIKTQIMQQIRRGKQIVDSTLIKASNIVGSLKLQHLEKGTRYGYLGELVAVDQLGNPDIHNVESYYGNIVDIEAAKRFGTVDMDEYSYWAWRSCGVANVDTILSTFGAYNGSLYELVTEIKNSDGYLAANRWGDKDIGWKHTALRDALINRGIRSEIAPRLGIEGLLATVSDGALVIASVKSRLSEGGSHMILVKALNWEGDSTTLEIYDPYTLDGNGGSREITLSEFRNIYLNRGIISWVKQSTTEV